MRRVLAKHNQFRASRGIAPLQWNTELANDARRIATQGPYMEHMPCQIPDMGPCGQCLWGGSSGYFTPESMVQSWYDESTQTGFTCGPVTESNFQGIGHYTQVMWANTRFLGCFLQTRPGNGDYLVCNYSPPGNYIGQSPWRC